MNVKQSNNILPNVRQIVHPEYGENYWFNGCAAFLMECLGEKDFDYWFFAGLTDENFTQFHSKDYFRGNGIVDYNLSLENNHSFIESIFAKIGYASTNVPIKQLLANREMYIQTVISYIDKGTPVILSDYGKNPHNRFSWGVLVGYEDYGKTLLYIGGDGEEPDRIAVEDLLPDGYEPENNHSHGWLFIGEKKEDIPLEKIFRDCILTLPEVLSFENSSYCFGAKAFREWASKIEKGYYNGIKAEEFDPWGMYTVYICALATNSGGCKGFLEKAFQLNPDLTFIPQIIEIYTQTGRYWNNDNGTDLEALNGGFNVTLNALQNKEKRGKIAAKLLEFAKSIEDVMVLIKSFNRDGKAHNL